MAKKKRPQYTSKGQRRSVAKSSRVKREPFERHSIKFDQFLRGRKVYFTIDNPNPNETNKRRIRVEGRLLFGDWRKYHERVIIR